MEHLSDHDMFLLGKKQTRLKFCRDNLVEAKADAEVGMNVDDVVKWEVLVEKAQKDLDAFVLAKGITLKEEEPAAPLSERSVLVVDVSDDDVEMPDERKIKAILLTSRYCDIYS